MAHLRINSFVAKALGCSRRKADRLLKYHKNDFVINGEPFSGRLNLKIDPKLDEVLYKHRVLKLPSESYIVLNKPAGYVTSKYDPHAEKIILDLLPQRLKKLKPIGRLDKNTRGLLLLTDNGKIIHNLLHPKYGVEKQYIVKVKGMITDKQAEIIANGIELYDVKTLPCKVKILEVGISSSRLMLKMIEGKKRQIRRMFAAIGYPVIDLLRVAFGPIKLGKLKTGKWRFLSNEEIDLLKKCAKLHSST